MDIAYVVRKRPRASGYNRLQKNNRCQKIDYYAMGYPPIILTSYNLLALTQCKQVLQNLSYIERKRKLHDLMTLRSREKR